MITNIEKCFQESAELKLEIIKNSGFDVLTNIGDAIVESIMGSGKLMLCGNGGSASDAQHLAAELLIRLKPKNNREGIPAIALSLDSSTLTACGNDFGYDLIYERLVKTLGNKNDCLLVISTSGNSINVTKAIKAAKNMGIKVFGFLGSGGGEAIHDCELAFLVPSNDTARIQECHIVAGHALMEYIEDSLLEKQFIHIGNT